MEMILIGVIGGCIGIFLGVFIAWLRSDGGQLDRIEKKLSIIIERNYKVDNYKALSKLKQPVSPAKEPKNRGKKLSEKEKKARKKAYMAAWYQKNKGKVTTKKK